MKRLTTLLIAVYCCLLPSFSQEGDPSSYDLIWTDEFNASGSPDATRWDQPEYNRRNNNDGPDGYWKKEDAFLDGEGNLVIRVRKITNQNGDADPYDYSTGAIRTKDKFMHRYGRYEMRARLPKQPGWWIAFWMMQGNVGSTANQGIDGSEVDIMEGWGWNEKINHAIHWDGYGDAHKSVGQKVEIPGLSEGYHIYTLDWFPNKYVFYIDGIETWRTEGGGICTEPGYIKITGELSTESWAITEYWANNPEDAVYPDTFLVDYVRVYDFPVGRRTYFADPYTLPGLVEAENYDLGESEIVYHDAGEDNSGNVYRAGDVDVTECAEGGFALTGTEAGEWLEYSVDVQGYGLFDLEIRAANPSGNGTVRLDMDRKDVSGNVKLTATSGLQEYSSTLIEGILLSEGDQLMRLNILSGNTNINFLRFSRQDILFSLNGLKDRTSVPPGISRELSIHASTNTGSISSIGFFLNGDSIGGVAGADLNLTLLPEIEQAGWNEVNIRIFDSEGNFLDYSMDIFFGDMPPLIEIYSLPDDTLVTGQDAVLAFSVTDLEGTVDSVKCILNGFEKKWNNESGLFEMALDTLEAGHYRAIVLAWDNQKNQSSDTLEFHVVLPPNILPLIQIIHPSEGQVLYTQAGNTLELTSGDMDGTIVLTEVFSDDNTELLDELQPGLFDIDHLLPGEHKLFAKVTDDRGGQAYDSVAVIIADSVYTVEEWTLFQRNGSLAYLSIKNDTLLVDVLEASGNRSDIQLMKAVEFPEEPGVLEYTAGFNASSTKYTYIDLCLKNELFSEDTMFSGKFYITPQADSFALYHISPADAEGFLAFYLGYRKGTLIEIQDLNMDVILSADYNQQAGKLIFPNPTRGKVYFSEETDYSLFTINGSMIFSKKAVRSLDLIGLEDGIYLLKTANATYRLVKIQ